MQTTAGVGSYQMQAGPGCARDAIGTNNSVIPLKANPKRPNPALARRRRKVIIGGVLTVVLGVGAVSALVWPGYAFPEPLPTPTITVVAALPTPTAAPAPREGEQTALVAALPDVVLGWVQTQIAGNSDWQNDLYAVEAWTINYADKATDSGQNMLLNVGQWATSEEAASVYRKQTAKISGTVVNRGEVLVGEQIVGQYTLFDSGSDGDGEIWWRNGTVLIRVTGQLDALADFYSAYSL